MFYTIAGAILGSVGMYVYCKLRDVSFHSSGFFPSDGGMCVMLGFVVGGCIGFGYGVHALANGTHIINRIHQ